VIRPKATITNDCNFDTLIDAFKDRIYSGFKGEWRLRLLQEDLHTLYLSEPLRIWDAGCGMGQLALWFADKGHTLTCCDISAKMLDEAKKAFSQAKTNAHFKQCSVQEMATQIESQDLILFHAVLEWLAYPLQTLSVVSERIKPQGYLSLLFYNYHSFVYRNAIFGEWRLPFIYDESIWYGKGKKLTPPYPQKPEEILVWLKANGFEVVVQTGIRVFHDYMNESTQQNSDIEALMRLEYKYCREPIYRDMGRYIHILARKSTLA